MGEMGCPVCGHEMIRKKIPYYEEETGFYLDDRLLFDADVCEHCDETFYTEEASKMLDLIFIDIDVWGSEIPKGGFINSTEDLGHGSFVMATSILLKPPNRPYMVDTIKR